MINSTVLKDLKKAVVFYLSLWAFACFYVGAGFCAFGFVAGPVFAMAYGGVWVWLGGLAFASSVIFWSWVGVVEIKRRRINALDNSPASPL